MPGHSMRLLTACLAAAFTFLGAGRPGVQPAVARSAGAGLYASDPHHLWNRIHGALHVRIAADGERYGFDRVDPLLWRETQHLLRGSSHARAVALLDEFLASRGERRIADPLKRAVFQNDLWTIFDWLAVTSAGDAAARRALMSRIAPVMRRVALTRTQIERLPDTYAAATRGAPRQEPALPPDLASVEGPWIGIGGTQPIVPQHASELGQSAFIVLWSVPGGSAATFDYLRKLWEFREPFVPDESIQLGRDGELRVKLNPALPPVPAGTRIALIRKMLLVDDHGVVVPTNIVQSIQLRTFQRSATFAEWVMSRERLFAGASGGLRRVAQDERGFLTFSAHGIDPFEHDARPGPPQTFPVLTGCPNCHQTEFGPPMESIRSLRALLRPNSLVDPRHERWSHWFTQPIIAAEAKRRTYEWGVLEALWQSQPR